MLIYVKRRINMSLYNSNNGQRRLRFNFGKKFTPKPLNPELSEQENMMNMINDYRQWQQDNPQPDCSNMSTREILEAVVSDFRAQQREEEETKKAAQMQTPYAPMQNAPAYDAQRSYVPTGQATYGETETIGGAQQQPAQTQESTWRKVGGNTIDSELTPIPSLYSMGEQIGELTANAVLGAKYVKEMKNTGNYLVNKYGQGIGAADGIDDYYHPLLQCYLAQISPQSGRNGLMLGYAKEHYYDYPKKYYWRKMPKDVILQDLEKDLANNQYGHDMGRKYPNKSCIEMLEHLRPPRMKKEGLY